MASTIGMVGGAAQPGEALLNGVKSSRFSLRLNMLRVRRWVMEQLFSVPVRTGNEQETAFARPAQFRAARATIQGLVDDYMAAQFARRLA